MDVITAVQNYVQRMIESVRGMKVLLLDHETMGIISSVFSQNDILQQEVYLFDLLETPNREVMTHLKAICFVRPTQENLFQLTDELKKPKYEQYHLFFTNVLKMDYLEELAHGDEHEVVQQVQEYYADYYPINRDLFSLNIDSTLGLTPHQSQLNLDRICDGLASVLLSLKRRPLIRYEKSSETAQRTAQELARRMLAKEERTLFDFGRNTGGAPVLLILDRRSDPITPLLMQWTYQAMVHEILGIHNNRVPLKTKKSDDEFYKDNVYSNFGDLGINVKKKVEELQSHSKSHQNIQTIEDMKTFIQNYPEFQKLSGNVEKHVTILSELSRINTDRQLYPVSEAEQDLATQSDHSAAVSACSSLLADPKVRDEEKLRLLLLYAVRYETQSGNQLNRLMSILQQSSGISQQEANSLVKTLLRYAGAQVRSGDLFCDKTWFAKARSSIKRGMKGATNVYTQHTPYLTEQLTELLHGKLSDLEYPAMGGSASRDTPSDIIVFFVGGATYEEALALHELKSSQEFANVRIVLGGTNIHNSTSFLQELRRLRDSTMNR